MARMRVTVLPAPRNQPARSDLRIDVDPGDGRRPIHILTRAERKVPLARQAKQMQKAFAQATADELHALFDGVVRAEREEQAAEKAIAKNQIVSKPINVVFGAVGALTMLSTLLAALACVSKSAPAPNMAVHFTLLGLMLFSIAREGRYIFGKSGDGQIEHFLRIVSGVAQLRRLLGWEEDPSVRQERERLHEAQSKGATERYRVMDELVPK